VSTTFDVYPSTDLIPSFAQLLTVATNHLTAFLRSYDITTPVTLDVAMRHKADETNRDLPFDLNAPAWWPNDHYAWFFVQGVPGGTDAYARIMNDLHRECLVEEVAGEKGSGLGDLPKRSLQIGRYWAFRRSAGQLAITNVAYVILAASLAELTNGFVHSSDLAWDYRLLPAQPAEFLKWYFRPELATDANCKDWSQRCINGIAEELQSAQKFGRA